MQSETASSCDGAASKAEEHVTVDEGKKETVSAGEEVQSSATEEQTASAAAEAQEQPVLTKSQRKKLEKQQKLAEHRKYCRAKQHEKRKRKRNLEKKQAREALATAREASGEKAESGASEPKRSRTDDGGDYPTRASRRQCLESAKIRVAFDCSFDNQMTEHDVRKLINQIGQAYGANRKARCAAEMHICGVDGKLAQLTSQRVDVHKWTRVSWHTAPLVDVFAGERERVVYLTSDSETVLDTLDPLDVYVIGGLVDHNRLKGICFRTACENKLRTARLPIATNLRLASSSVLSVYHVFAILLRQLEVNDWRKALIEVIPKRKVVEVRNANANGAQKDSDDDEDTDSETQKAESDEAPVVAEATA